MVANDRCPFLSSLDISGNNISAEGIKPLVQSFSPLKSAASCFLLEINVSYNAIKCEGAARFGKLLRDGFLLEKLDLSFNQIDSVGAKEVAEGLATNKSLTYLNMSGNEHMVETVKTTTSQYSGISALCDAFKTEADGPGNSTLNSLNLASGSCLDLPKDTAHQLAKVLSSKCCAITSLDLSANQLNSGCVCLFDAFKFNTSVKVLRMYAPSPSPTQCFTTNSLSLARTAATATSSGTLAHSTCAASWTTIRRSPRSTCPTITLWATRSVS